MSRNCKINSEYITDLNRRLKTALYNGSSAKGIDKNATICTLYFCRVSRIGSFANQFPVDLKVVVSTDALGYRCEFLLNSRSVIRINVNLICNFENLI